MTTAIEPAAPGNHLATVLPMLPDVIEFAKQIANTAFAPDSYRGKPAEITACMFYAMELGIGPMTALQKIDVIKGRPAPRAELGRALALRAGHEIWIEESTNTRVKVSGQRRGSDHVTTVVWTMDDAKRAGLAGSATYRAYPRQMLTARATAELVRMIAPDVLAGIDAFAEELDGTDGPALVVDETPPTTKRKRRSAAAPDAIPETSGVPSAMADSSDIADADTPPPDDAQVADIDLNAPPPALTSPNTPKRPPAPSAAQMKAMHATLGEAGFTERADRLAFVTAAVGRTVDSSKDITKTEAGAVIDTAQRVIAGTIGIIIEPDGGWTLTAAEPGHGEP